MFKNRRNLLFLIIVAVLFVLIVNINLGNYLASKQAERKATPSPTQTAQVSETISYKGKEGKDALSLLEEQATVVQSSTGLVITINGKKADEKKREYWAFYINGKLSEVGPESYVTKDTDKIEWKIEKY